MKKFYILLFSFVLILVGNVGQANAAGFTDVKPGDSFYEEIMYLYEDDIISGYTDGRFGPTDTVTRGAAALMIARALDLDTTPRDTEFPDVKSDYFASGAIQSAASAGILSGYHDGKFMPKKTVTRGEMAIFIAKAFKLTDEEVISFTDVPISKSSYSSIRKILADGVTVGYNDSEFRPDVLLKRNQFSAFLARALNDQFKLSVETCGYDSDSRTNPDLQTVNCLLTRSALTADFPIPPEIVKAVAIVENGAWKQFDANGEPVITEDGGIGLMQVTNTAGYDVNRLKYDLTYNISVGVDILIKNFKRTNLPSVAEKKPEELESWYFAVMAYNGTKAVNSPIIKATGERNVNAYQEKVFRSFSNTYFLTNIYSMVMTADDFHYGEDTNWNIVFKKEHFPILGSDRIVSKEIREVGSPVQYSGSGLRSKPSTSSTLIPTSDLDTISLVGGLVYDINKNSKNTFGWYPAKFMKNGKPVYGYIASPYIQ